MTKFFVPPTKKNKILVLAQGHTTSYYICKEMINMKVGMRKPSLKKSLKARTTGRVKRAVKSTVNPFYGKKGMGFIKNPERSIKNSIYKKTTFSIWDLFK